MKSLVTIFVILCCVWAGPAPGAEPHALDILVYGATGKVGSQVVVEALDRGHRVTAVSRHPEEIALRRENLAAAKGDLLDLDSIRELVAGRDVVIVSVRGVIGKSKTPESALQYLAVRNVVEVLREMGDAAQLRPDANAGYDAAITVAQMARMRDVAIYRRSSGTPMALFRDQWQLQRIERDNPELTLDYIVTA